MIGATIGILIGVATIGAASGFNFGFRLTDEIDDVPLRGCGTSLADIGKSDEAEFGESDFGAKHGVLTCAREHCQVPRRAFEFDLPTVVVVESEKRAVDAAIGHIERVVDGELLKRTVLFNVIDHGASSLAPRGGDA